MSLPFTSYTGVDLSDSMLDQAVRKFGALSNVKFQQLDLMTDPLPEGQYGLITSTWAFEHLDEPIKAAEKAWEKLKPGGRMAFLFEVEDHTPWTPITGLVLPFFHDRRIKEEEYRQFPGEVVVENHFTGVLGDMLLFVLEKPKPAARRSEKMPEG